MEDAVPTGSTRSWFGRASTQSLQEFFARRIQKSIQMAHEEDDEVEEDPNFATGETCITFKDVSFSIPQRRTHGFSVSVTTPTPKSSVSSNASRVKVILAPVSGHYEPGSLVAVMGPSGSGKTTLLDILAAKKTAPYEGIVHINGRPRDELFHRISAYVPQEDVMPAYLTVEEVVMFHSALKEEFPSKLDRKSQRMVTDKRLRVLGLADVKKSYVGDPKQGIRGISGGQRRRLSLARGLASGAQLIFCDEPTSGLSATDAETCVRYMRQVAHKYRVTVIISIHQPRREVARMFDHLLMLTSNPGRAIYQGPMRDLPAHAEKVGFPLPERSNPTDFFMDWITPSTSTSRVDQFDQYFTEHCRPAIDALVDAELLTERKTSMEILEACRQRIMVFGEVPPVRNSKFGASFAKQLRLVFMRQLTLRFRDKWNFIGELGMSILKAIVIGVTYTDIGGKGPPLQVGFFFFIFMACSIDGLKTMPKVISERTVMKMETSEALYSEWAYILAFTVISSLQALFMHTVFITLLFPVLGFPWLLFPHLWLWSMLLYFVMDSLYLMLSGIAKDATMAQVLSLPFLMMFLLYNGFTVARNTAPPFLLWAIDISPVAYAMEAITVAAATICSQGPPYPSCRGGADLYPMIVIHFGYEERTELAMTVFVSCMLIFRGIHVVCLKCLNGIQR